MQILVIEEQNGGTSLKDTLHDVGLSCITATSEREGLKACLRTHADILFLDLEAPHVDPERILHDFRKRFPTLHAIPVSAQDDEQVIERLLHMGAEAYLIKPVRPQTMLEVVDTLKERVKTLKAVPPPIPFDATTS